MTEDPAELEFQDVVVEGPRMAIAIEALPFTQVMVQNADELLRQWIFKEVHGLEVPMSQGTIDYCEQAFQWIRHGSPKSKIGVVK